MNIMRFAGLLASLALAGLLKLSEAQAAASCTPYQGYAKGNWRGKTEYVVTHALLCGSAQVSGKLVFQWDPLEASSDITGSKSGNRLELRERVQKGNGAMSFSQQAGWLKGTYRYYHQEYSAFEISLVPMLRPSPWQFLSSDVKAVNQFVNAAARRKETWVSDPVLTALTVIASPDSVSSEPGTFWPAQTFVQAQALAAHSARITVIQELHDDSLGSGRYRLELTRSAANQPWQIKRIDFDWKCQSGRGHQDYSRKSCI